MHPNHVQREAIAPLDQQLENVSYVLAGIMAQQLDSKVQPAVARVPKDITTTSRR